MPTVAPLLPCGVDAHLEVDAGFPELRGYGGSPRSLTPAASNGGRT